MAEIILKTEYPHKVHKVLFETVETEILRLKYSLGLVKKRLLKFEKKYNITSKQFIESWTAEDLKGKDMEYVAWAGEHKHYMNLNDRLDALKSIIQVS